MSIFTPTIRYIQPGNSVTASVTNAPMLDLASRTIWLRDQLQNLQFSYEVITILEAPVVNEVTDWSVVYWDYQGFHKKSNGAYAPAVGEIIWENGEFVAGPKNYIVGVIGEVTGNADEKVGTLYLRGFIRQVATTQLLQSGQSITYGYPCYLTNDANNKGKVVTSAPYIQIIIGYYTPIGFVLCPYIRNLGETHHHYKFDLSDRTKWQDFGIYWLYPATELDPYPPLPYESAILEINGSSYVYGNNQDYYLDADGVKYIVSGGNPIPPSVGDPEDWDVFLYYLIPKSLNTSGITSLTSSNDIIEITTCGGNTSELILTSVNIIDEISTTSSDALVVKKITSDGIDGHLKIEKGPYVNKILAGNGIEISSSIGDVTVSLSQNETIRNVITDIALQNAKERIDGITTYIGFPKEIITEILCKFRISKACNTLSIYIDYIGKENSIQNTVCQLNLRYSIINSTGYIGNEGVLVTKQVPLPAGYIGKTRLYTKILSLTNIAANNIITLNVERDITDTYESEFGILFLEYICDI